MRVCEEWVKHRTFHPKGMNVCLCLRRQLTGWSCQYHMLVSKIKPCMSKYKHLYCETANGSLNQLSFIWLYSLTTWITVVILELIHAKSPDSRGRDVFIRLKTNAASRPLTHLVIHSNCSNRMAFSVRAGDVSFKFLPYQLSMVR